MNSITIKDKHYILINSKKKATRCEDCDLHNHLCDCLCYTMATLCGLKSGTDYVFKELQVEKSYGQPRVFQQSDIDAPTTTRVLPHEK